jgi:hypothetical protein
MSDSEQESHETRAPKADYTLWIVGALVVAMVVVFVMYPGSKDTGAASISEAPTPGSLDPTNEEPESDVSQDVLKKSPNSVHEPVPKPTPKRTAVQRPSDKTRKWKTPHNNTNDTTRAHQP